LSAERRWRRPVGATALWPLVIAPALGAAQSLALTATALWWLPLGCITALAWLWQRAAPRSAALLGWLYGTAWLGASVWWLFISMHRYGGLAAPLAALAVALLCGALALYLGAALGWAARQRSGAPVADAARFAAAWLGAELARAVWFTGFPWGAIGYTQVDGPLAALAPWLGVYGMGAVLAMAAALLAGGVAALGRRQEPDATNDGAAPHAAWPALGLAALLLAGPALLGRVEFTRATGALGVALLQPNVSQDEKFALERLPDTLAWVQRALTQADAALVVAPETAVPLLPDQLQEMAPGYWDALAQHFGQPGGPVALVGVPLGSERDGYTNSVVGLAGSAAPPYRYDKHHLVPFGEFIPTGFRWFTELMNIPLGDFNRGPLDAPSFAVRGERVAPNICYEDLFGEELARRFAHAGSAPTMLVNLSNIGWFGDSVAVPQHLVISRLRSLELQRPMLRATNTGATAVVDHRGIVTAALAPHTVGVLTAQVQGRDGLTPFARWAAAAGLWPLWALAAAGLAWPRGPGRRQGRPLN
jgi:apolipoprotein N-acyltransferase